ncbi:hypothetical protein PIB30_059878 [Stylosanthes scabra]|uniref:Uncharacterized protein n=1 Tax=Stylosanthes scabra TaxID=79078 RepID=A0ABU6UL89_9FABA|nr:hypothetical protein [Stylosanthes scabra]
MGWDVELTASELTPFLPSVAFRDWQLRSSTHFNPWPRHKVRTHRFRLQLRRDAKSGQCKCHDPGIIAFPLLAGALKLLRQPNPLAVILNNKEGVPLLDESIGVLPSTSRIDHLWIGAEAAKGSARNEKITKKILEAKSSTYACVPKTDVRTHWNDLGVTSKLEPDPMHTHLRDLCGCTIFQLKARHSLNIQQLILSLTLFLNQQLQPQLFSQPNEKTPFSFPRENDPSTYSEFQTGREGGYEDPSNGAVTEEMKMLTSTLDLILFDLEIERTLHSQANDLASENDSAYSSDPDFDLDLPSDSGTSTMGDVPRLTLKQLGGGCTTMENQPTRYPKLNANFELKSGLINLLPKFHGLSGEDKTTTTKNY